MRHLPTLFSIASICVLLWALASALRIGPRLTWMVPAYLAVQCGFALAAVMGPGIQRASLISRGYRLFFTFAFGLVLLLALRMAVRMAFVFPDAVWLISTALLFAGCQTVNVYGELRQLYGLRVIPPQLLLSLFQGGVLFFCGLVCLSALFHQSMAPELRFSSVALGGFWTALGLFAFAWPLGFAGRNSAAWLSLNSVVPACLAIVAFGWLALQLGKLQSEVVRQEAPARIAAAITFTAGGTHV